MNESADRVVEIYVAVDALVMKNDRERSCIVKREADEDDKCMNTFDRF